MSDESRNDLGAMRELADSLCKYIDHKLSEKQGDFVRYFRAEVTTAPANGVIGVTKPYDAEILLPYVSSLSAVTVGTNVMVLVLGSAKANLKNAFVLTDTALSNL